MMIANRVKKVGVVDISVGRGMFLNIDEGFETILVSGWESNTCDIIFLFH